jgi:succinyl-CoA synthetase beta subunit
LADLRDPSQEEEREVEAARHDLSYVGLAGRVGCMVNGAGLAMATMDLLRLHGAEPANFLDVGGAATAEKVAAAFRILAADPGVRAILVNIFGGIVQCDLVAEGILEAVRQAKPAVPLVVRLEGNRAAEGRRALAASGLRLTAAETLDGAARSAAEAAR